MPSALSREGCELWLRRGVREEDAHACDGSRRAGAHGGRRPCGYGGGRWPCWSFPWRGSRGSASEVTSPGGHGGRGEPVAPSQGHVDQADQDGDLDERSYYAGEGLAGGHAEGGDGDRDGQLEVVAGGREGEGGRAVVGEADRLAQEEGTGPHHGEVHQQ